MVGSKLDFSRRKEAHRMAVGLMDIKGQYAELQDRIEAAVLEVLRSGRVILGPNVKGFEEDAAAYMGTAGAVGVGRQAEEVDRHDGLGARREGAFDGGRVDAERVGEDVDEHR